MESTLKNRVEGAAPIALFVYNRPSHTRQTLDALARNALAAESDLFIFADGPRDEKSVAAVREVRQISSKVTGFRTVTMFEREANLGLARSIIAGVTEVCERHGRVIVLEDDLVTAPTFLRYMNDALGLYENETRVGSIHGYWYPIDRQLPATFFLRGASCWGWATWARAWRLMETDGRKLLEQLQRSGLQSAFDLGGTIGYTAMLKDQIERRNDSWAIRWHASMFLADRLQLSPNRSLVRNIGFDGSGVHSDYSNAYDVELHGNEVALGGVPVQESVEAREALADYYRRTRRTLLTRIRGRLRRMTGL